MRCKGLLGRLGWWAAQSTSGGSQAGGIAYAAHVGGFIAGLVLVKLFAAGHASR